MQTRTSAGTSINSAKLPVLYTKLAKLGVLDNGTGIDFGSGKYTQHLQRFAEEHGSTVLFFDPYNQSPAVNAATLARRNESMFCLCSNVLNVIDDDDAVRNAIRKAVALGNGVAYFSVYEGNGTGIGFETQNGRSWQRNQKLREYRGFCDGLNVAFQNGIMIVRWEHEVC